SHPFGKCAATRVPGFAGHVVGLAVEFGQVRPGVGAHLPEHGLQEVEVFVGEYVTPVLRHEDHVDMQPEYAVTTSTVVLSISRRPTWCTDPHARRVSLPRRAHWAATGSASPPTVCCTWRWWGMCGCAGPGICPRNPARSRVGPGRVR